MAEIITRIQELEALPAGTHWFCPRKADDDGEVYFFDEDVQHLEESDVEKEVRKARIKEALDRKSEFFQAAHILAFDGPDADPYKEKLGDGLRAALVGCSICVREFHRARSQLQHDLEGQFDVDTVLEFMSRFDEVNSQRIANKLDLAKMDLLDLEPSERKIGGLSEQGLFGLFEAVHCVPVLRNEQFLSDYFDQPFRLVQTNQKISLPEYTPALTTFLFSENTERRQWALRGWQKFKRNVTASEFEWAVKDQLKDAMDRVPLTALQKDFMPTFWEGVQTILSRLDREVIVHHLRAMDVDLCRLALDHMQVDSPAFLSLLASVKTLLEKAPVEVWTGLGTISPSTVLEQIFNSPNMARILRETTVSDTGTFEQALSWTTAFMRSLRPGMLAAATKTFSHHLLVRAQANGLYPDIARMHLRIVGLRIASQCLKIVLESQSHTGPLFSEILEATEPQLNELFVNYLKGSDGDSSSGLQSLTIEIIVSSIEMYIRLICASREAVISGHVFEVSPLNRNFRWDRVLESLKSQHVDLIVPVLHAFKQVVKLEPIPTKTTQKNTEDVKAWNSRCSEVFRTTDSILERLQDLEGEPLGLFLEDGGADGLLFLLFAGHQDTQRCAASTLRVLTSESSRSDAMKFLLTNYYTQTLCTLGSIFKELRICQKYIPSTMAIKIGMDSIQLLFDSQDGITTTKELSAEEVDITRDLWKDLWLVLDMIFAATESWAAGPYDKDKMKEFCRDVMDFAGRTFDVYSVISGLLHTSSVAEHDTRLKLDRTLLQSPTQASINIVKWLRLRDEYLVTKAVSLVCKLLGRLQEVELKLPVSSVDYIEKVVTSETRNKVPDAQKAELRRSLNLDEEQVFAFTPASQSTQKAHKQGSLKDWVSAGSPSSASEITQQKKSQGIDFAAWKSASDQQKDDRGERAKVSSASSTVERFRAGIHQQSQQRLGQVLPRPNQSGPRQVDEFRRKRQAALEAKAKRDKAAIAAARGIGNAGSGLSGIGVEGKDHSSRGQGVMVSSDDSDSDSDDGGLDEELFGPSTKPAKKKSTVAADAAGAVGLKREVKATKIHRQVRSKKDLRARLQPDLTPLHKVILGWDYFFNGDYPPGSDTWQYQQVAKFFRHVDDYKTTFEPLLILEAWQGLIKAREEENSKPYEIKIGNRINVDAFIELSTLISAGEFREIQVSEGDVILFSESSKPTSSPDAPHCLARVSEIKRKGKSVEVLYRVMPGNPLLRNLTPGALVYGLKIQSIIPLEREYSILLGLPYYDLCDEIIKARPSPLLEYNDKQLAPLISTYSVNKAQAKAVRSALDNDAFTLIQGPPGSGKTKTIVAIVGALLSDVLNTANGSTRIVAPTAAKSNGSEVAPKKLLVCAPSNAAVDELVMRFKQGVTTVRGAHKKINVVRVGRSEAVNSAVQDVTMEELINKRLGNVNGESNAKEQTQKLMLEHKKVSESFREVRDRIESSSVKAEEKSKLQGELDQLRRRKAELGTQIDNAKDAENAAGRTQELHRKMVQQSIIEDSHVICATLSGSGHQLFRELNVEFETVVVDEAAQCVEMSALIPLKYGCAKCILVGDPKQLPPTVFSKEAAKFQYEQSLFVRMQNNFPDAVHLLDTQYRMHPDISAFPSATFYDGRLLDGDNMAELRKRAWHTSSLLAPYRFFDVQGQHEAAPKGHSLVNRAEINVAVSLYERLTQDFRDYDFNNKIGIITPYKSQLRYLKETFVNRYGGSITDMVEFNTTDAFQGRESEIIIFSCVRASPSGNIGFLQDIRRMNVGLTRAKCSLWVLGNSQSLMRGQFWKKLVEDARERDLYTTGNLQSILSHPSSKFIAAPRAPKPKALPPLDTQQSNGIDTESNQTSKNSSAPSSKAPSRVVTPKNDLAMFRTGSEPPRRTSLPTSNAKDATVKAGSKDIKHESTKTESKADPGKPDIKKEPTKAGYKDDTKPGAKLEAGATKKEDPETYDQTKIEQLPDQMKKEHLSDQPKKESAAAAKALPVPPQQKKPPPTGPAQGQGQIIKRKAPSGGVFMPARKRK